MSTHARAAAVDIGSNSLLITIAEYGAPKKVPLKLIVDEANVTGLSKGLMKGSSITEEAQQRAFKVFKHYAELLRQNSVTNYKVVATEALRRAKNGNEVRNRIEKIFSAPVEIISGDREAELSFWSVQKEFVDSTPDATKEKLIFDIGGASTEICWGSSTGIKESMSVKVGSVVLTEKFGLQKKGSYHPAKDYVMQLLNEVPWLKNMDSTLGIGVAGTMTTLIAIEKSLRDYERDLVHKVSISGARIEYWLSEVMARDTRDRTELIGLTADRADVFGGGLVILKSLVDFIGWKNVICMDAGIRFGLLYELLGL